MEGAPKIRGRSREVRSLERAVDRVRDGHGLTLVIEGEAGIGKTALIDVLLDRAGDRGFTIWQAKAQEFEQDRPFASLRTAVEDRHRNRILQQLETAQPTADRSDGWVDNTEIGFRVIDTLVDTVDEVTSTRPLALVIDDAQWIDELSLAALGALDQRLTDRPLLLCVASRPVAEIGGLEASLPIAAEVRIVLDPLDDDSVAQIVTDHGLPPDALLEAHRSGGNPFFLLALIDGWTRRAHSEGSDHQAGHDTIPESVTRIVLAQLHQLDPNSRQVVRLASVLGTAFSVTLLAELTERPVASLVPAIDRSVGTRLLVESSGGLSFRHDLVRQIVYDSVPPSSRSALHLDIGRRLLELDAAPADVVPHFIRGAELGDVEAAWVLRRAARDLGHTAPATATRLLERALALLPDGDPDRPACRAELVESYVFSSELERSSELADELLAGSPPIEVELSLRNARTQVFFLEGLAQRAAAEFEAMVPLVAGQAREAVLLADAAVSSMFAIDLPRARSLARRSLTVADEHGDLIGPALANGVLSWISALDGDLQEGRRLAEEAVRVANAGRGLDGHRRIPHLFHAQVLLWCDLVPGARASLHRGRRISDELGMGWDQPMYQALLADERIRSGQLDDALAEVEVGLLRAEEVGSRFADGWLHAHRARVFLLRGELDGAVQALDEGDARLGRGGGQGLDQLWMLRGLALAVRGDTDAAVGLLVVLWDRLGGVGARLRQLELAPDLIRLARRASTDDVVARVMNDVTAIAGRNAPSLLADSTVAWCGALVDRDAELARRAVAITTTRDHPLALAACRLDAASLLEHHGCSTEASDLRSAAAEVIDGIGAHGLTALASDTHLPRRRGSNGRARHGWESLTDSERRIVMLVGDGMTNVQIARELDISRRTVESHLYHAYPKLGLSSRVELAVEASKRK